jgi:hypothetical protein
MNDDWLAQLAPEHAPAAPGWWPLAPGWWLLAVVLLAVIGFSLYWWQRPLARQRRFARKELRRLRERSLDPVDAARAIQSLLRRYALAVFGRDAIARLSGEAWLEFVIDSGGEAFVGRPGHALLAAAFGDARSAVSEADRDGWFEAADQFLRRARPTRRAAR